MNVLEIPPPSRSPAEVDGFACRDGAWRLDLDRYGAFVDAVTGIRPDPDVSATDCYRIRNRLEAFISERRRTGGWTPALVDEYPDVESLDQISALARFFRHCHEECLRTSPTPSA